MKYVIVVLNIISLCLLFYLAKKLKDRRLHAELKVLIVTCIITIMVALFTAICFEKNLTGF